MKFFPLGLDVELYFDKEYNIKTLSTSEYVRHAKYEQLCGSIVCPELFGDELAHSFLPTEFKRIVGEIDWAHANLIAHNAKLEAFVLHTHHNVHPGRIFCTRDSTNALFQGAIRADLNRVCMHYGLPLKTITINKFKGIHLADMDPAQIKELTEYCDGDTSNTYEIWKRQVGKLPEKEIILLDMTCKMFSMPRLEVDVPLAEESRLEEADERKAIIAATGHDEETLGGVESFATLIKNAGITPPTKVSKKTGITGYAFAKTDLAMHKLLEHEDPIVAQLAAARLAVKSTGAVSRAERFITMGTTGDRLLAVWLNYYGAHTGRWSGGNKMNLQNLVRGSKLRRAARAKKNYVIVVVDSSQIEARDAAWLANETQAMDDFLSDDRAIEIAAKGGALALEDSYTKFATTLFGYLVTKAMKTERFVGKVAKLGLQYQMGAPRFQHTLASGIMGMKVQLELSKCYEAVNLYRAKNAKMAGMWPIAEQWIQWMTHKGIADNLVYRDGLLQIDPVAQCIWLPNGMPLAFPKLGWNAREKQYEYWNGKYFTNLYGGKLIENVVQALSRIIVSDQMLMINEVYPVVTMSHDEIVVVTPENEADACLQFMYKCMRTPPAWAPNHPLNCEGGYDVCYSK